MKYLSQQLALTLPLPLVMAHLYLVKTTQKKQETPRRGKGSSAVAHSQPRDKSTERRYRYPSDEIWQVSEERWQVAESRHLPETDAG